MELSRIIAKSDPLKPDIRLVDAVSKFAAALESSELKKHKATFKNLRSGSPTAHDVVRLTEEINRDGQRLHKTWWPCGTRFLAIFEQIHVFTRAGDILIGGSQNMIASGVWAAVRLSLQLAIGHLTFFDKVSALFMRIGKMVTAQTNLVQLFPSCHELHGFLCEYLIVIVNLCHKVVTFMNQSYTSKIWSSLTTSFDREFTTFEGDLQGWAALINNQWKVLLTQSQQRMERQGSSALSITKSIHRSFSKKSAYDNQLQIISAIRQLSPHQDEFTNTWRRERKKGSCRWLFEEPSYVEWSSRKSLVPPLIWIWGHLGSGKTVLMANVVANLTETATASPASGLSQGSPRPYIASFFCQYHNKKSLQPDTIIKSILFQFLANLESTGKLRNPRQLQRLSWDTNSAIQCALEVLPRQEHYFVVLDAMDECKPEDFVELIQSMQKLRQVLTFHMCFSTRSRGTAQHMHVVQAMQTPPVNVIDISMTNTARLQELSDFVSAEIERRQHIRDLDPQLQSLVQEALVAGAQGMYLWVVLQIESLFPRHGQVVVSNADISNMLGTLPQTLFYAIERAISNIWDKRYGSKIFQIVSAATRPLTTTELAVALNITPGEITWDSSTLAQNPDGLVYACGGGLLDIDEERDTVHWIHHSALHHFMSPPSSPGRSLKSPQSDSYHFAPDVARELMACLCVTYLFFDCHSKTKVEVQSPITIPATHAVNAITALATAKHPWSSSLFSQILPTRPYPEVQMDFLRALQDFAQPSRGCDTVDTFSEYVNAFWVDHSAPILTQPGSILRRLFQTMVTSSDQTTFRPWAVQGNNCNHLPRKGTDDQYSSIIVLWCVEHQHVGLTMACLQESEGLYAKVIHDLTIDFLRPLHWLPALGELKLEDMLAEIIGRGQYEAIVSSLNLLFLPRGINLNQAATGGICRGFTPLHLAVTKKLPPSIISYLIYYGADPDFAVDRESNEEYLTTFDALETAKPPLLLAVEKHWLAGVAALLGETDADFERLRSFKVGRVTVPVGEADVDFQRLLPFDKKSSPRPRNVSMLANRAKSLGIRWPGQKTMLGLAIEAHNLDLFSLLLKHGAPADMWYRSQLFSAGTVCKWPLFEAVLMGDVSWLRVMREHGVNVTEKFDGMSALDALYKGRNPERMTQKELEIAEELMNAGCLRS